MGQPETEGRDTPPPDETDKISFEELQELELEWIQKRRKAAYGDARGDHDKLSPHPSFEPPTNTDRDHEGNHDEKDKNKDEENSNKRDEGVAEEDEQARGELRENLIGLALSGGGLRSANFSLGLLQGLKRHGVLPYVDYLSGVSGGAYTAGYYTTMRHQEAAEKAAPTRLPRKKTDENSATARKSRPDRIHPTEDDRRFRTSGRYLRQPLRLLGNYVPSTAIVLALYGSALLVMCFIIALIWREFDMPEIRESLGLLGWNSDFLAAFAPTVFLTALWLSCWLGSWVVSATSSTSRHGAGAAAVFVIAIAVYFYVNERYVELALAIVPVLASLGAIAEIVFFPLAKFTVSRGILLFCWLLAFIALVGPLIADHFLEWNHAVITEISVLVLFLLTIAIIGAHKATQALCRCTLLSVIIAVAVLIVDGDMTLGPIGDFFGVQNMTIQANVREPLAVFVLVCLGALIRHRALVRSRRAKATVIERFVLRTVTAGIILGLPLVIFGWAAREDFAGYTRKREPTLTYRDIRLPASLPRVMNQLPLDTTTSADKTAGEQRGDAEQLLRDIKDLTGTVNRAYEFAKGRYDDSPYDADALQEAKGAFDEARKAACNVCACEGSGNPKVASLVKCHDVSAGYWLQAAAAGKRVVQIATIGASSWELQESGLLTGEHAWFERLGWFCVVGGDGPIGWRNTTYLVQKHRVERCVEAINANLGSEELTCAITELIAQEQMDGDTSLPALEKLLDSQRFQEHRRKWTKTERTNIVDGWRRYHFGGLAEWGESSRRQFNRNLLVLAEPDVFRRMGYVSTGTVVLHDQKHRAVWLLACAIVLFACLYFSRINGLAAVHSFYKRRLEEQFLQPSGKKQGARLAEIRTSEAPYPLFLAALHTMENSKGKDDAVGKIHHSLVYSPLAIGAAGEYTVLDQYRSSTTIAEAVAISGSALSPMGLSSGPLRYVLSAFNLRTGQWVRRDNLEDIKDIRPIDVVREGLRIADRRTTPRATRAPYDWQLAYAADGGYHEFLGLDELIRRRCRLIIVCDAGCNDGEEEFEVLADAIRTAERDQRVTFLDLDDDRPLDIARLKRTDRFSPQHAILGRIRYPYCGEDQPSGAAEGVLVYAQMTMTGDEPADLRQLHAAHKDFPDQPTTNQFLDERMADAFRTLGLHTADRLVHEFPTPTEADPDKQRNEAEEKPIVLRTEEVIHLFTQSYAIECAREEIVDDEDFTCRAGFFTTPYEQSRTNFKDGGPPYKQLMFAARREYARQSRETRMYEENANKRREVYAEVEKFIAKNNYKFSPRNRGNNVERQFEEAEQER